MIKLQKIKDKIYCSKHNLEYTEENIKKAMEKELVFGCKITCDVKKTYHREGGKNIKGRVIESFIGKNTSHSGYNYSDDNISAILEKGTIRTCFSISKNNVKSLGTDITLEDLLKCLSEDYAVTTTGHILKSTYDEKTRSFVYENTNIFWRIGFSIDNQSPETVEAIYNLLFN